MKKHNLCALLFLAALTSACDRKGGMDLDGDGKPDGIKGDDGYCPPYSDSHRPHSDGYCYPG